MLWNICFPFFQFRTCCASANLVPVFWHFCTRWTPFNQIKMVEGSRPSWYIQRTLRIDSLQRQWVMLQIPIVYTLRINSLHKQRVLLQIPIVYHEACPVKQFRQEIITAVTSHARPLNCFFISLSRPTTKKMSKLCLTDLLWGNLPATGGLSLWMVPNSESVSNVMTISSLYTNVYAPPCYY